MEHASLPTGELVRLAELDAQVSENQDVTIHENGAGQAWDESRERQRSVCRRGRKLGSGGFGTVYREDCVAGELSGAVRAVKCIALNTNTHGKRSVDYGRELKAVAKFSQKQVSEQCDIDALFRGQLSTHQSFCSTPTSSSSPMDGIRRLTRYSSLWSSLSMEISRYIWRSPSQRRKCNESFIRYLVVSLACTTVAMSTEI